jgi:hypothetical protein
LRAIGEDNLDNSAKLCYYFASVKSDVEGDIMRYVIVHFAHVNVGLAWLCHGSEKLGPLVEAKVYRDADRTIKLAVAVRLDPCEMTTEEIVNTLYDDDTLAMENGYMEASPILGWSDVLNAMNRLPSIDD